MGTFAEVAERDGVSKAAVSKAVRKLIKAGHEISVERDGRGRITSFGLAQYDHNRGFFRNSEKARVIEESTNDRPKSRPAADSYDEAKRRDAWLTLQRKQLVINEEFGSLVRADKLALATAQIGQAIQSEVKRIPNRADEVALAVSKHGEHGARSALKKLAVDLNQKIADVLQELSDIAPQQEPALDEEET